MKVRTFAFVLAMAAPLTASAEKLSANGRIDLLPLGGIEVEAGPFSADFDTKFAFAFGAEVFYEVAPNIHVGIAPRYILNVDAKPPEGQDDDDESASQIDIPIRGRYTYPVTPEISAFGALGFGYSMIQVPEDSDTDNPAGLIVNFGAGATYAVDAKLFALVELSYQLGFQGVSEGGVDGTFATSFLTLGLGFGSKF